MSITGKVKIGSSTARLNGNRLAICGDEDPFAAAIAFLGTNNIEDGERIIVEGSLSEDEFGESDVFCMTDARHAPILLAAAKRSAKKQKAAKKAAASRGKSPAKKRAVKRAKKPAKKPAKKSSSSKTAAARRTR